MNTSRVTGQETSGLSDRQIADSYRDALRQYDAAVSDNDANRTAHWDYEIGRLGAQCRTRALKVPSQWEV